jgi:hypothetical protein
VEDVAGATQLSSSVLAERLTAQLLAGEPAGSALEVTRRLLAVQGQDQRGARLAIRARSSGLTAADVDHALTEERSLLITWVNRGTLHLRDARAGVGAIASKLRERPDGLLELRDAPPAAPPPRPRLLGAFDPLLLGWCSREDLLAGNEGIVTTNGLFRPFALVDGRAVATWSLQAGKIELKPFKRISAAVRSALRSEEEEVRRYLGLG